MNKIGTPASPGNIPARAQAYMVKELLERGFPHLVFEKFGNSKPLPTNSTKVMEWRRYFLAGTAFTGSAYNPYEYYEDDTQRFDVTTRNAGDGGATVNGRALTEGVTPNAVDLDKEDINVEMDQYGMWTELSDQLVDFIDDPVMQEAIDILAESGAYLAEQVRFNALVAGTNVYYATDNATKQRSNVNEAISLSLQRLVIRGLKRNLAKPITKVVKSTPAYGTEPIAASFVAVAHPDLEADIRSMDGFVPSEKYGTVKPLENEIGKVESVRYVLSTVVRSFGDTGSSTVPSGIMGGDNVTVYPILVFAQNAYAIVPLKGKNAVTPMVLPPNVARGGDPLGQRGTVGIKFYHACKILQDMWMARIEVAASDLL